MQSSNCHTHVYIPVARLQWAFCLQILAPHEETSVLTQLANLPDDSEIEGAVGVLNWQHPFSHGLALMYACRVPGQPHSISIIKVLMHASHATA